MKTLNILAICLACFTCAAESSETLSDSIGISGFARVVGGQLDTDEAEFQGYSNDFSFSEQSLFALQADISISEKLKLSAQLLGHSNDDRDSGLEWLYLTYNANSNWSFKLGKLRTPFFRYSDVLDVGFAYPWITPPEQVYGGFLFSNYEGLSATYRIHFNKLNVEVEAYYGTYDGTFDRAGEETAIEVNDIRGLILGMSKGGFRARASAIVSSDFFADIPGFQDFATLLELAGYTENADVFRFDSDAVAYQASLQYDSLDYFVYSEVIKIESDLISVPEVNAYYLTLGYHFDEFQIFTTIASANSSNDVPTNQIPKGQSPQLTSLSFAYDAIVDSLPRYDLDSLSVGLRWDFRHNMSAKAEVTWLSGEEGQNSFYSEIKNPAFDRNAVLTQFALEWVF